MSHIVALVRSRLSVSFRIAVFAVLTAAGFLIVATEKAEDVSSAAATNDKGGSASTTLPMFAPPANCPGAGSWSQQAHPFASDGAASDEFGTSVAVDGDTAVVGAIFDDNAGGANAGAAYVYVRSGTVWTEQQKLTANDAAASDLFGASVAISGDLIIVGAEGDDNAGGTDAGSAYVFVRSGTVWTQQAKLTASDAAASDFFGSAVATNGATTIVGSAQDDNAAGANAGAAYIFVHSGAVWSQQAKLVAADGAAGDGFGNSVAVSSTSVVVGASLADTAGGTDAGAAYVFTQSGTVWPQQQKLIAPDGAASDNFGSSVAIHSDIAVVGAPFDDTASGTNSGSAYVFTRSGTVWTEQQQLMASDGAASDLFGNSVSVDFDTVIVGERFDDTAAGSAFIFQQYGTFWAEEQKLAASDRASNDLFGASVAIDGGTVIVGAYSDDTAAGTDAGSSYIFIRDCVPIISSVPVMRSPGAGISNSTIANVNGQSGATFSVIVNGGASATQNGITVNNISVGSGSPAVVTADVVATAGAADASFTLTVTDNRGLSARSTLSVIVLSQCPGTGTWNQQAHPTAADAAPGDLFGVSAAISGDTTVVGAESDDNTGGANAGAAYVFTRSGTVWTQQAKLTASDAAASDFFGFSVSISGDTIVVGSLNNDNVGGTDAGAAYVFTRSGTVWTQQQKLTASDGAAVDNFGYSVAISGDTVIVGALIDDNAGGTDAGSAYIFTRSGSIWTQQQKLTASDGAASDEFGVSVAISGDTVIVGALLDDNAGGADAGGAYVFTRSGTVWTQQQKLTASDAAAGSQFGVSVGVSGDSAVAGANGDDAGGINAGAAYVFTRSGTAWTQQQKLTASDPANGDQFGHALSISGDTVLIAAQADDTAGGTDAGSAYVFTRSGTVWTEQQKLTASDGAASDELGISVAISGDTGIVGAYLDDTAAGTDAGSAYIFKKACPPATPTNTPTITATSTATNTSTTTPTRTATSTPTATNTPTNTATNTPTNSATNTPTNTAINTPTNTATDTPTATPTPADTPSISGVITYGNPIGNPPPPRFVRNVSVASTSGMPTVGPVITGTPGTYTLSGFGATSYTIKPTKPGGANTAITSADAARVAQGVAGSVPFVSQNQRFASDTSGNGGPNPVTSNDAALIARFVAGLTGFGRTGSWYFFVTGAPSPMPTAPATYNDHRDYASVTSNLTGEDYVAILVGETTGNYNPANNARPATGPENSVSVEIPQIAAETGKEVVVPVRIVGAVDKEITSYEFNLRYDASVIQPAAEPVDVAKTASRGLSVVVNPYEPGRLRVVMYGAYPIDCDGILLNLRFTPVGNAGTASPLIFEQMMFNEGEPSVTALDGRVELF